MRTKQKNDSFLLKRGILQDEQMKNHLIVKNSMKETNLLLVFYDFNIDHMRNVNVISFFKFSRRKKRKTRKMRRKKGNLMRNSKK